MRKYQVYEGYGEGPVVIESNALGEVVEYLYRQFFIDYPDRNKEWVAGLELRIGECDCAGCNGVYV